MTSLNNILASGLLLATSFGVSAQGLQLSENEKAMVAWVDAHQDEAIALLEPPGAARLRRRVTTHWGHRCAVAPSGGQRCWLLWGFGGHLGGGLVPPGDPQSQATLSSPAPRAQGGLLDGAPAAPKDPRDHFSARADDMIVHMKCFGTRQASAKPLQATPHPPPFRTRPHRADAHFPPSRRTSSRRFFDALTVPSTLQFIPKLGGSRGRAEGRWDICN